MSSISSLLQLLHEANNLKYTLRHSFGVDGRQESVAEHTWRMAFMAVLIAPKLSVVVSVEKVLKMILIHDLNEAYVGDVPAQFQIEHTNQKRLETENMIDLLKRFPGETMEQIAALWHEYEANETVEAKFAKSLDKMECRLQHNENDITTWSDIEFPRSLYAADKYCTFDLFISELNEAIKQESRAKIAAGGYNVTEIEKQAEILKNK